MRVGERVGPFDIEKQLGSGAMGAVYRAKYRKTGKPVAIKVMLGGMGGNATALARFEREWEVLKQLNHPNIVQFYIANQFQGAPYYAMEFIEGEALDEVLVRRGRLTWEEVVTLGQQICSALQHAHDQGIIHRDLKPSNLMLTPDGALKLTDFGIAKDLDVTQLTAAHCTVGTASYMSPEQCRGEKNLSHKSDLYSLGVVLYELLTGRKPFLAETTMDMFMAHVQGAFEQPSRLVLDIPVWLNTLVCQLLEKEPTRRPFDAAVVNKALEQVAERVAAQQSAGVAAAQARIVDRDAQGTVPIDETDHQAARTLLTSLRKRRRKRRGKPFYQSNTFQAIGLMAMLLGVGAILYQAFRAPAAEDLYQAARRLMESEKSNDWTTARDGPIKDYLNHYQDRDDEQTRQVLQWADQVDVRRLWNSLHKRRQVFNTPDSPAEGDARVALGYEESGKLMDAQQKWQALLPNKNAQQRDLHVWGLLAEKRIQFLEDAESIEQRLRRLTAEARNMGQEFKPDAGPEQLASEALRYEEFEDLANARTRWADLRTKFANDFDGSSWALLATRKWQDLKERAKPEMEEPAYRVQLLAKSLARCERFDAEGSLIGQGICRDMVALYGKDPAPEVVKLVAQARSRIKN